MNLYLSATVIFLCFTNCFLAYPPYFCNKFDLRQWSEYQVQEYQNIPRTILVRNQNLQVWVLEWLPLISHNFATFPPVPYLKRQIQPSNHIALWIYCTFLPVTCQILPLPSDKPMSLLCCCQIFFNADTISLAWPLRRRILASDTWRSLVLYFLAPKEYKSLLLSWIFLYFILLLQYYPQLSLKAAYQPHFIRGEPCQSWDCCGNEKLPWILQPWQLHCQGELIHRLQSKG